jgi:hypothetical protein
MRLRRFLTITVFSSLVWHWVFLFSSTLCAQQAPPASGARILILPRRVVSGEQATLAVLDVNGRLTPGVTVNFSNGDQLMTDATGRALFVAPLNPGVVFGTIAGRAGRVPMVVLSAAEAGDISGIAVSSVPRIASLSDRFEVSGQGFCGEADANQVTVGGQRALVLAASPSSLAVLPPPESAAGSQQVNITCGKRGNALFLMTFVELQLEADSSPLTPGEHRTLTVRVRGTNTKVWLEARNLAPDIAELSGGTLLRLSTSGGAENLARFEIAGHKRGSFLISIRLLTTSSAPHS